MKRKVAALLCASVTLAGCETVLTRELRHPGGYPGFLLDERTLDGTEDRSVQLLRAAMLVAMASRMATATIQDGADADAFRDYLVAATDELNYAASNLYPIGQDDPCTVGAGGQAAPCKAYYVNFEADVPLLEARIVRLMLAALPEEQAREFMEDITQGNIMGAAWNAVRTVAEAADGLRRSAAVFRSNLELAAAIGPCKDDAQYNQDSNTVLDAARCFRLEGAPLFSDERISLDGPMPRNAFHSVMLIARTSCARLPVNQEGDIATEVSNREVVCAKVAFQPKLRPAPEPEKEDEADQAWLSVTPPA